MTSQDASDSAAPRERAIWGLTKVPNLLRIPTLVLLATGILAVLVLIGNLAVIKLSAGVESASYMLHRRHGVLLISGGKPTKTIERRFVDLAGGPEAWIVVIPTAHEAADKPDATRFLKKWRDLGVESVELLHTRSRDKANTVDFFSPIDHATGVWFEGGKQKLLAQAYGDTPLEAKLKQMLGRGGVIGGNSAGAAIMSKVMIEGGKDEPTIAEGLDLVPGVIIDQHFLKRNRFHRLRSALHKFPTLVGLGIDEGTAVIIEEERLSVIGDSYVTVCLPEANSPDDRVEILRPGDETDLGDLRNAKVSIAHAIDLGPEESEGAGGR